ncbi:MAG: iron-containing alcohol dehydrogenase [Candidatus Dormibacteraeota bacterium]|nr:iron-containing alcohol dehydrogenase [Candidatus Dormibacteraeota bacterium]
MSEAPLSARRFALGPGPPTYFGPGELARLPSCLQAVGMSRALVVTDPDLVAAGVADRASEVLSGSGLEHRVHAEVRLNPGRVEIAAGAAVLRDFGPAAVVGLGGGTALDAAKAIALAAANPSDGFSEPAHRPGLPVIAIPTTAGSGSETNGFAVLEEPETHRKFYVGHPSVSPRAVILDPALTVDLPAGPTAACGIDALTHAVESMSSVRVNPYAHGLGLEVVGVVARWLGRAVACPDDLEARSQMLLAAHMAGLAFATTGLGLCHAIGHALSARLGTVHGVALAVVLPPVLEFNRPVRGQIDAAVAGAFRTDTAAEGVGQLIRELRLPQNLAAIGCPPEMVPELCRRALADEVIANTPRLPAPAELAELLLAAM